VALSGEDADLVEGGAAPVAVLRLDGDELAFPFKEMTLFEGLESDLKLLVEPQIVRREYLRRLRDHQARIRQQALEAQATYLLLDTREAPGDVVLRLLRERRGESARGVARG